MALVSAWPLLVITQPNGVGFAQTSVMPDGQFKVVGEHARGGLAGGGLRVPMHVGPRKVEVVGRDRSQQGQNPTAKPNPLT